MKVSNLKSVFSILVLSVPLILTSCSKEDTAAMVSIVETGSDLGGDVTGTGGSTQEVYTWANSLPTVEYNMDITSTSGGSFNLRINDADGEIVLDETLVAGQGDDSKSGVSTSGRAGAWTVTVTLENFNGDGSFSLSPGN